MRGRDEIGQACELVDRRAEPVAVTRFGRAEVDTDPAAELHERVVALGHQRVLVRDHPDRGRTRIGERGDEPVARVLEDLATVVANRRACRGVVPGERDRHPVGIAAPESGAPGDVGHRERTRHACRAHTARVRPPVPSREGRDRDPRSLATGGAQNRCAPVHAHLSRNGQVVAPSTATIPTPQQPCRTPRRRPDDLEGLVEAERREHQVAGPVKGPTGRDACRTARTGSPRSVHRPRWNP